MKVYSVENGETVYEQDGCVGTKLYEAAGNEYVQLAIQPGSGIPEHVLPIPVSFCVLSGAGTVLVEGEAQTVAAGEMVECLSGFSRGWKNETDALLEVLVIKRA